ncbi:MAG: TetR/AcrR family transcriptional regulator [Bacteroidota bacterium]
MKETILHKAMDMFLTLGFKSVTMDDIAAEMSISKKTIYQYYANKNELVSAVATQLINKISDDIDQITLAGHNPMKELFEIRNHIKATLDDKFLAPLHQLKKYYNDISVKLRNQQFNKMHNSVMNNIQRGMDEGLYRTNLDKEFISRLYFTVVVGIKEGDVFPAELFNQHQLTQMYLEYHLRAIASAKGLILLDEYLQNDLENS